MYYPSAEYLPLSAQQINLYCPQPLRPTTPSTVNVNTIKDEMYEEISRVNSWKPTVTSPKECISVIDRKTDSCARNEITSILSQIGAPSKKPDSVPERQSTSLTHIGNGIRILSHSPGGVAKDDVNEFEHPKLGGSLTSLPSYRSMTPPPRSINPIVMNEAFEDRNKSQGSELGLFCVSPAPKIEVETVKRREQVLHPAYLDFTVPRKWPVNSREISRENKVDEDEEFVFPDVGIVCI
eukprot:TRINITY_DN2161_c0_g1_i1.p1 TRINITY_DN2161_c0_g1~~TRINITY_DN2161_c0_g1_i1.p1  ORF type:complete len:238 (+),score=40.75 TRINITY_DN2161_c0_g1_i1:43-756(+)